MSRKQDEGFRNETRPNLPYNIQEPNLAHEKNSPVQKKLIISFIWSDKNRVPHILRLTTLVAKSTPVPQEP